MATKELPRFFGENPEFWIDAMEEVLCNSQIPYEQYVQFASQHLVGVARLCFIENQHKVARDWCAFSYHLLWEFDLTIEVPKGEESEYVEVDEVSSKEDESKVIESVVSLVIDQEEQVVEVSVIKPVTKTRLEIGVSNGSQSRQVRGGITGWEDYGVNNDFTRGDEYTGCLDGPFGKAHKVFDQMSQRVRCLSDNKGVSPLSSKQVTGIASSSQVLVIRVFVIFIENLMYAKVKRSFRMILMGVDDLSFQFDGGGLLGIIKLLKESDYRQSLHANNLVLSADRKSSSPRFGLLDARVHSQWGVKAEYFLGSILNYVDMSFPLYFSDSSGQATRDSMVSTLLSKIIVVGILSSQLVTTDVTPKSVEARFYNWLSNRVLFDVFFKGTSIQMSQPTNVVVASFVADFYAIPRSILSTVFKCKYVKSFLHCLAQQFWVVWRYIFCFSLGVTCPYLTDYPMMEIITLVYNIRDQTREISRLKGHTYLWFAPGCTSIETNEDSMPVMGACFVSRSRPTSILTTNQDQYILVATPNWVVWQDSCIHARTFNCHTHDVVRMV